MIRISILILLINLLFHSSNNHKRVFTSSFESVNDFDEFYITPQNHLGTTFHELTTFQTPCYISLWVWLDMDLKKHPFAEGDWFSFATFTDDESDNWYRTVLVNLSADGFVHLQHTTNQGEQTNVFQTTDVKFPQRE